MRIVRAIAHFVINSAQDLDNVSPISKVELRRLASRQEAAELLQNLIAGEVEAYQAYRGLYGLWCSNNAAVQELRPLFRIDGIEPDGPLSVNEEFREQVLSLAKQILPQLSD
jgi:hypothetical protein